MPILFDAWIKAVANMTWKDELGNADDDVEWPNYRILTDLIVENPNSKWFNNISTVEKESSVDLINQAFKQESLRLIDKLGILSDSWEWKNSRGTDIHHLVKIPGFGRMHLPTGGDWNIPNATARTHGPSWRYVVELGEKPKGYGIYPGGQSGFPGSKHYDEFVDGWVKGELYELHFPYSTDELDGHMVVFRPKDES